MTRMIDRRAFLGLFAGAATLVGGCTRPPPETLEPEGGYGPVLRDERGLVSQVTELVVETTPSGLIVRATGLAASAGYWNADLVPPATGAAESTTLQLDFRARPPVTPSTIDNTQSRTITAAYFVSNKRLEGVRTIEVVGQTNSRTTRR